MCTKKVKYGRRGASWHTFAPCAFEELAGQLSGPRVGCRGGRWNTTSEQFYYVAWAFYCFATVKAAVLEDDGLFFFPASTLVMKMLLRRRWVDACLQTSHATGMKHAECLAQQRV